MDPIHTSLTQLMEVFHKRMSDFEAQLQKTPAASASSSTSLASDFAAFKVFITQALGGLQQQVELLARSMDNMEMRSRKQILLLHGVSESKDEDTAEVVVSIIRDRLKMSSFTIADIKRCHRMGRAAASQKTRPILFKLHDRAIRSNIWFEKVKLKGSGITISEFLTKARHDLFLAARHRFGLTKCWTRDGCIYVVGPDGTRHRIVSLADLERVQQRDGAGSTVAVPTAKPTASRPKRERSAVIKK